MDAALIWGGDLGAGPTGDLALVAGAIAGQQRVLRRLLTNPGDYVWHPTYGAGLANFVGQVVDARAILAAIRSQIFKEAVVARTPEPAIDIAMDGAGGVFIQIRYVDAPSGTTQLMTFSVDT